MIELRDRIALAVMWSKEGGSAYGAADYILALPEIAAALEQQRTPPRCAYCGGDGTTCNAECRP